MSSKFKLIESEEKPWSEGTIHIFWPSAVASQDDERFVAWCREQARGELKDPEDVLPIENTDRFCKTCIENAKNSENLEKPEFIDSVNSEIETTT